MGERLSEAALERLKTEMQRMGDEREFVISGDDYQRKLWEILSLKLQVKALREALKRMIAYVPECAIEDAREAWGNTNTELVLMARREAEAALRKARGEADG